MKILTIRIQAIEDKIALKNLVDTFSILADRKDIQKQILLFTEDAVSDTFVNGKTVSSLKGRKQIGDAFTAFLNIFETVYHINGQQTVTLNGDNAYRYFLLLCYANWYRKRQENENIHGAYYTDEFVRAKWSLVDCSHVNQHLHGRRNKCAVSRIKII